NLFQSNMVLQRDVPIRVWGAASPGARVTVSFAGMRGTAEAGPDRRWMVTLPEVLPASDEPRVMTISSGGETLTYENVLLGDVWVLGGQSNMEHAISRCENGDLEIASANFPRLRIMTVPYGNDVEPVSDFASLYEWSDWFSTHDRKGFWEVCTPETVRELSGLGYVFVRRVHMASQVPIGVIDASRGGTTVETWTPRSLLRASDRPTIGAMLANWDRQVAEWDAEADLANRIRQHEQYIERMTNDGNEIPADRRDAPDDLRPGPIGNHNHPSACYNGMLVPLRGLAVKGAIFHQGYNNCFDGTNGALLYRDVFPLMIAGWRETFGDPEMPFCILSLCTEGAEQTEDDYASHLYNAGPMIREAQHRTYLDLLDAGDR
ncbi:MAG: hypothetical protein KDA28_01840, partial [Phycisphaerales bacterium]|nr:hypothetical protein [Phycisphaerales bacterium]